MTDLNRRDFVLGTAATGLALAAGAAGAAAGDDRAAIYKEIERRHDEAVQQLQDWIRQPTIAAEQRGVEQGADLMVRLLKDAGFQRADVMPTDGVPGVFATLDAGARKTVGLYFMYDVKQANPVEWSSPPWDARIVDMPNLGTAVMGRGAVNQKGPESAFLAALHAIRVRASRRPRVCSCRSRRTGSTATSRSISAPRASSNSN